MPDQRSRGILNRLASLVRPLEKLVVPWAAIAIFLVLTWQVPAIFPKIKSEPIRSAGASSKTIAITNDGRLVLAVNPDSNSLSVLDAASETLLAEVVVGSNPRSVAILPDSTRAYVTNRDSDNLSVFDLVTFEVIGEINVGDSPIGVAISPDGKFLAVAESGDDTVSFIQTDDLAATTVVPVGDRPYGLSFTPDGRYLLVSHLLSGQVTVIPVRPYWRFLPLILGGQDVRPGWLQGPDELFNEGLLSTGVFTVPTWPYIAPASSVVVNSAGTRAYLAQTMANGQGLNTQFDNTVFPKVSVVNLESWTHQSSEHVSLPEIDRPVGLPWDVALAQNDTELWIVNSASNDISVVDISNPQVPGRRANLKVGDNPRGIALDTTTGKAYVNNTLSGTITIIDTNLYTTTAVVQITEIPLPPLLLNGKRLFHSSARPDLARAAWISCNTCHIEQEHDGRTWLIQYIGEIPPGGTPVITRNTTGLLGMIETYPLRWSAEWDESADSEFSIRFEQFGTGLIDGDIHPTLGLPNQGRSYDLDSLAAYIDSLPAPERTHALTLAEWRGKAIFESPESGCMACHPPPVYTDLQQHDVGTAGAAGEWFGPEIDTPTLRFLYDSAPYLHDGSAETLWELLTAANPADEHGATSQLTDDEIADLIAFLLVLPYE